MAPNLGKRKRVTREELEQHSRSPSPASESENSDGEDIRDIFRKAFEAKFKPIEVEPKKQKLGKLVVEENELEEESDWSGISSEDEIPDVEIIDYASKQQAIKDRASKAEMKAFMSSKPPTSTSTAAPPLPPNSTTKASDDPTEATHLKNDLALQRLLRDSHLLSKSSSDTSSLIATGAARHKSTDLQLLSLGSKTSIHAQKSMPMSHRKGINSKAREREEKRRAEAKENGIILEREVKKKKFERERERGLGAPAVGKFRGGMLKLSRNDVRDITGGGGGGGRGGRGGKGKRGRR